jgi:hypothetical protein
VKEFDLKEEIARLKSEVNMGDLSLEDVKKIFKLITEYVKSKTLSLTGKYKAERRKRFPKETRFSNISEYMKETAEGLMQIQGTSRVRSWLPLDSLRPAWPSMLRSWAPSCRKCRPRSSASTVPSRSKKPDSTSLSKRNTCRSTGSGWWRR